MRCKAIRDGERIIVVFDDIGTEMTKIDAFISEISNSAPDYKQMQAIRPLPPNPAQKERVKIDKNEGLADSAATQKNETSSTTKCQPEKTANDKKMIETAKTGGQKTAGTYTLAAIETMTITQMIAALEKCDGKAKEKRDKMLRSLMYQNVNQLAYLAGETILRDTCKKCLLT